MTPPPIPTHLQTLITDVRIAAEARRGDCLALLSLLRTLEHLHREVRDNFFQEALPTNRQALYSLLRDIEAEGGWPYIHRMRLQTFLSHLLAELENNPSEDPYPLAPPVEPESTPAMQPEESS